MARERTRPALSDEVVTTEQIEKDGETFNVEVHTFAAVPFSPNDVLKTAIDAEHVTVKTRVVEFNVNDPKSEDYDGDKDSKTYRQTLTETYAKNQQGALAIFEDDAEKVWDAVSSAANRNQFQNVYVDMRNAAAGPEKAIKKIQKLFASLSPAQLAAAKEALGL